MDDAAIQRDGRWWHPLPGGAWALWDGDANAWLPTESIPPPPPLPAPGVRPSAGPPLAGTVAAAATVRRAAREPVEPRDAAPAPSRDDTWGSVRVAAPVTSGAPPARPSNGRFVRIALVALVVVGLGAGARKAGLLGDGAQIASSEDVAAAFAPVRGFRYGDAVPGMTEQIKGVYEERAGEAFGPVEVRTMAPRRGGADSVVVVAAVDPGFATDDIDDYASWVELGSGMGSAPVDLAGIDGLELAGPRGSGGILFVDPDGLMFTVASARLPDARRIATQLARANG